MCVQCAFDASKAAGSAGGAAGAVALLASASASLGLTKVSGWLVARDLGFLTPGRVKVATAIAVWMVIVLAYARF